MTVWCSSSTISIRRFLSYFAMILAIIVAFSTTIFFAMNADAQAGVNQTINFQGRLTAKSGEIVPDGHYNMQFKIYQDGDGKSVGNTTGSPGSSLKWTENYVNRSADEGVFVRNGMFSVNLGSNNPFGTQVDWNQSALWLSVNVAGASASCTTFGTNPCAADGEMLPMKRITASPYALNAGALGGKTAENFVQLGQGVQTDASTNSSSIFVNKTGTGNLLQLQNAGTDIFTIGTTGSLTFGAATNQSISIATSEPNTDGRQLSVTGGAGGSGNGSTGGDLILQGGDGGGTNGNGGNISIDAGGNTGTGTAGAIAIGATNAGTITIGSTSAATIQNISIGANNTEGSVSNVTIGSGAQAGGGSTTIQGKDSVSISVDGTNGATFSGDSTVYFGNGVSASAPNNYTLQGTDSTSAAAAGGSLTVQGGNATVGDSNGGDVIISGGKASGSGTDGLVVLTTPTYSTVTNDSGCFASGELATDDCLVSETTVNSSSAVILGFNIDSRSATLPDPTNRAPGRILNILSATGSAPFAVFFNDGTSKISMYYSSAASLIWNGDNWVAVSTSNVENPTEIIMDRRANSESPVISDDTTSNKSEATAAQAEPTIGSMYYDTTLGKVQCYEETGWGPCGASPDTFISLSPEYSNAVTNGSGVGTLNSDFCSDMLNVNDGSEEQPTICGKDEMYNFYNWTAPAKTAQTKSIYVTYQLPANFNGFVKDSTSLMARTTSDDAEVTYEIYANAEKGGRACTQGPVSASKGAQTTWQKSSPVGMSDPADCDLKAGDTVLIKVNMTASKDASAYVSNLNFAYSTKN